MLIEALTPLRVKADGKRFALEPGQVVDLSPGCAARLLERAHGKVRAVLPPDTPAAPLHPGWLVVYRDRRGTLCGGRVDREHGTVQACRWEGNGWTVHLTDGQRLSLSLIRSVGQTDAAGQIVAAWTVKEHGVDGNGTILK